MFLKIINNISYCLNLSHSILINCDTCLFLNSNKFWYSTGQTKMKAFRAYFEFIDILAEVENAAGVKICVVYDDATGIKTLSDSTLKGENTYNLAGQRVGKNYKGIVVTKGKKVLR